MQFPADLFINIRVDYCRKSESSNVLWLADCSLVTDAQNTRYSEEMLTIYWSTRQNINRGQESS